MRATVVAELQLIGRRWMTAAFAAAAVFAAATVSLMPSVVGANDGTLGVAAAVPGLAAGAALSVIAGPLLATVLTYTEDGHGMRRVRTIAAEARLRLVGQCVAVALSCLVLAVTTSVLACVCGVADHLARSLSSTPTAPAPVTVGHDLQAAALLSASAIVISAAVLALGTPARSGSRTATVVVAAAGSWLALLVATDGMANRWWLMLHPLAGPWTASHLKVGDAQTVAANSALAIASSATWAVAAAWLTWRRLNRP